MRRTGLGRHGTLDSDVGDPLDGLVNLFDLGLVLAVAFLVAGLGLSVDARTGAVQKKTDERAAGEERKLTTPETPTQVKGRGKAVGTVYQLPGGELVLVDPSGKSRPAPGTSAP